MSEESPKGWTIAALGSLVSKLVDGSHNPPPRQAHGLKMLSARNVVDGSIEFEESRLIDSKAFEQEARRTRIEAGDVLLTIVGSIGRSAVVPANHPPFTLQRSVAVISTVGIAPEFLSYQLRAAMCQAYFRDFARGTAQKGIYLGALAELPIVVAPVAEQTRITAKIDELFSQIDEGERALERVRKLVERYRQSVLKAAVTGELTRGWREQHAGKLESGEALLTRILEARRQAWEQSELAKMTAKGCRPKNNAWKRRYKEPHTPDTESSDSLPAGWVWATIDQLCGLVTSGSRGWKEFYSKTGSTFIRAQNLKHDVLCLDDVAFVDLSTVTEGLRTRVLKRDLLVTITGANVTKSALVEDTIDDAYVSQHVALVRPVDSSLSKFLFQWIVSESNGRRQLLSAAYGAGKPGLNLEDVKHLLVALPSTSEQRVICDRLDSEVSRLSYVLKTTKTQKDAALALRQSVLKAAFSGQLVPQYSTDEPASVLLERIAAERAATPKRAAIKQPREKKTKSKAKA